jgi:hypothetical protein
VRIFQQRPRVTRGLSSAAVGIGHRHLQISIRGWRYRMVHYQRITTVNTEAAEKPMDKSEKDRWRFSRAGRNVGSPEIARWKLVARDRIELSTLRFSVIRRAVFSNPHRFAAAA